MEVAHRNKSFELKLLDHAAIEVSKSFSCNNCGNQNDHKPIGYANSKLGYMIVSECAKCLSKFRHHLTGDKFDLEKFKEAAGRRLWLHEMKSNV